MYGLEKEKKPSKFEFDLEVEIKNNPKRKKEIIDLATKKCNEIKNELRAGKTNKKEIDDLNKLQSGYEALQTVMNFTPKS